MKNITTSVLGYDIPVTGVPETIEEMVKAAGGESEAVNAFNNYIRFHKTNTEARQEVADRIESITGISRSTKMVKAPTKADPNNEREEYDESEADFAKRAVAEYGNGADLTQKVLNGGFKDGDGKDIGLLSIEFSAVGTGRERGPRKVAAVYTKSAEQLITMGGDKLANAIQLLQQSNPGTTVELDESGTPKVESLAAALKVNRERTEREANAALGLVA